MSSIPPKDNDDVSLLETLGTYLNLLKVTAIDSTRRADAIDGIMVGIGANFAASGKVNLAMLQNIVTILFPEENQKVWRDLAGFLSDLEDTVNMHAESATYKDSFYLGKSIGDILSIIIGKEIAGMGGAIIKGGASTATGGGILSLADGPIMAGEAVAAAGVIITLVGAEAVAIGAGMVVAASAAIGGDIDKANPKYYETQGCGGTQFDSSKPAVTYNGEQRNVYRGGNDFTIKEGDIKVNFETGNVKTTHGVSLNVEPASLAKYNGAYRIDTLPQGLKIIQRGGNAAHFEIVPTYEMPLSQFQGLLKQIVVSGPY